jgi:hypothetical protein
MDTTRIPTGEQDYLGHTPMMQQYRRMTFLQVILIGCAPEPSKKSVVQSPFSVLRTVRENDVGTNIHGLHKQAVEICRHVNVGCRACDMDFVFM